MTELCINGMNDLATKVNQIFVFIDFDINLIKSKGCGLFSINFSSFSSIKINRIN